MSNERPNVTVIYQDARPPMPMSCAEVALSAVVLAALGLAAGWWVWPW